MSKTDLDLWSRQLLRAAAPDLRRALGVERLDRSLVSEIYLRVLEVLSRLEGSPGEEATRAEELVEELALAIYLATAANRLENGAKPELLASLQRTLARAVTREPSNAPKDADSGPPSARSVLPK